MKQRPRQTTVPSAYAGHTKRNEKKKRAKREEKRGNNRGAVIKSHQKSRGGINKCDNSYLI